MGYSHVYQEAGQVQVQEAGQVQVQDCHAEASRARAFDQERAARIVNDLPDTLHDLATESLIETRIDPRPVLRENPFWYRGMRGLDMFEDPPR